MLAVGEHLWGGVPVPLRRASSALAGGLGCSYEEMCGALSGGALILGQVLGRTHPEEDDTECNDRVCAYRDRFAVGFGTTRCSEIRASGHGSGGAWPCSVVVERATRWLLEVLPGP